MAESLAWLALIAATTAGSELLAEGRARKNEYLATHLSGLAADDLAALERSAGVLERLLEDDRR